MFFGKKGRQILKEQDRKYEKFKEEMKEEPLEKGDYFAMVLGAFWALWPVLAIVVALIVVVSLFFF